MNNTSKLWIGFLTAMAGNVFDMDIPKEKHSINEIIEKSNIAEWELLEMLKNGIIQGKAIFGVPYIIGDTIYSIKKKFEENKKTIHRVG